MTPTNNNDNDTSTGGHADPGGQVDEPTDTDAVENSHVTIPRELWNWLTGSGCPCPRQVAAAIAGGQVVDAPTPESVSR